MILFTDSKRVLTKIFFLAALTLSVQTITLGQSKSDSVQPVTTFSASLGVTNNGFSIIPSFSFNKPAAIILLSWQKNKFSIDPDIRVTPDGKKGSMLLWFRYQAVQDKRFSLRTGVHPAINWSPTQQYQNGESFELLQLRRFLAWELAPSYKVNENWQVGIYYLQGNGFQTNSVRTTHFVTLNTTISNISISNTVKLTLAPALYYLNLDGSDGKYFTATAVLSNTKLPVTIQSTINKTITSNIAGNKDFLWNVAVLYNFKKTLK